MKINTTLPDDSVNSPQHSLFMEFVLLVLGIGGAVLVVYWASGLAVGVIAERIPQSWERDLFASAVNATKKMEVPSKHRQRIQQLVNRLAKLSPELEIPLKVRIIADDAPNALAFPGGVILVTTGFLEMKLTEKELALVLGHEIGHFVHRHHLKALGRLLVQIFIGATLGFEPETKQILSPAILAGDLGHSRASEEEADIYGIQRVYSLYGDASGATGFFDKMAEKEINFPGLKYLRTHPFSSDRSKRLNQLAARLGAKMAV